MGFFLGILRSGTIETVRAALHGIDVDVSDVVELPGMVPSPTPSPTPPDDEGGESPLWFDGPVAVGDVTTVWADGVPLYAVQNSNPIRRADLPREGFDAMLAAFPRELVLPMVALTFLESDFNVGAHNPSPLENSWGPWQINLFAWPDVTVEQATDWWQAAGIARAIYEAQGWPAWYNSARLLGLIE